MELNLSDKQIVERLIRKDEAVTHWFFYEKCKPLMLSLIRTVFSHPVDYDEVVNEVWLLLMEDNARRLKLFKFRSSLCQWLKITCLNHLKDKKNKDELLDSETEKPLYECEDNEPVDLIAREEARITLEQLLAQMKDKREVEVIRSLVLEDALSIDVARRLNITVNNLYVIKNRAMEHLTQLALSDENRRKQL